MGFNKDELDLLKQIQARMEIRDAQIQSICDHMRTTLHEAFMELKACLKISTTEAFDHAPVFQVCDDLQKIATPRPKQHRQARRVPAQRSYRKARAGKLKKRKRAHSNTVRSGVSAMPLPGFCKLKSRIILLDSHFRTHDLVISIGAYAKGKGALDLGLANRIWERGRLRVKIVHMNRLERVHIGDIVLNMVHESYRSRISQLDSRNRTQDLLAMDVNDATLVLVGAVSNGGRAPGLGHTNRVWERGRLYVEKFQKMGLQPVMKWDFQRLCDGYENRIKWLKLLVSSNVDCQIQLECADVYVDENEIQEKVGIEVVGETKYTIGEVKLVLYCVLKLGLLIHLEDKVGFKWASKCIRRGLISEVVKKKLRAVEDNVQQEKESFSDDVWILMLTIMALEELRFMQSFVASSLHLNNKNHHKDQMVDGPSMLDIVTLLLMKSKSRSSLLTRLPSQKSVLHILHWTTPRKTPEMVALDKASEGSCGVTLDSVCSNHGTKASQAERNKLRMVKNSTGRGFILFIKEAKEFLSRRNLKNNSHQHSVQRKSYRDGKGLCLRRNLSFSIIFINNERHFLAGKGVSLVKKEEQSSLQETSHSVFSKNTFTSPSEITLSQPKIVVERSDGSFRPGKKSGKEYWQHTKKWSRRFLELYNAETDPEVEAVMRVMGKDLDETGNVGVISTLRTRWFFANGVLISSRIRLSGLCGLLCLISFKPINLILIAVFSFTIAL